MKIDKIIRGSRYREELGSLTDLMESIEAVGLLHPVVITDDFTLVAGERRLEACLRLGWEDIPVRVLPLSPAELVRAEHDENTLRLDFTVSELVAIGEAMEPEARAAAKERQIEMGRSHGDPSEKFSEGSVGRVRDQVATHLGMSGVTYQRAKAVVEAARENPDVYGDIREQMDATGKVKPAFEALTARRKQHNPEPRREPANKVASTRDWGKTKPHVQRAQAAVDALAGIAHAAQSIDVTALDNDEAAAIAESLDEPMRRLNRLLRKVRKQAQGAPHV